MEEWIKKSDAIDVIKKNHYRLEGHGLTEELIIEQIRSIPSVQVPPRPKGDVIGYRWVLEWDLEELWPGLRGYERDKYDRPKGEMKSMGTYYKCTVCGSEFNDEITFMGELNYCPACGCSWESDDDE